MNEFKLPQKIQTKILIYYKTALRKCCYIINIPENTYFYQKIYVFICTTKLINNSEYTNYNITCGSLTHRTRGYS